MPIVTIRYRLPDEEPEHLAALQGQAAKACLWEIDQHCRHLLKYGKPSGKTAELAERIRAMIRESPERLLED